VNVKDGGIRQVKSVGPKNSRPRLCVALDYLAVMSRDDSAAKNPLTFAIVGALSGKPGFPDSVDFLVSEQMEKLDCIAGVTIWVFESGKDEERQDVRKWHQIVPGFSNVPKLPFDSAAGRRKRLSFKADDLAKIQNALKANGGIAVAQAFCQIELKKPTIAAGQPDWGDDMSWKDPWVFPLDLGFRQTGLGLIPQIGRPAGERGEVPDWKFLAKNYADKGYIPAEQAIGIDTN
jgi:hypothetical protein